MALHGTVKQTKKSALGRHMALHGTVKQAKRKNMSRSMLLHSGRKDDYRFTSVWWEMYSRGGWWGWQTGPPLVVADLASCCLKARYSHPPSSYVSVFPLRTCSVVVRIPPFLFLMFDASRCISCLTSVFYLGLFFTSCVLTFCIMSATFLSATQCRLFWFIIAPTVCPSSMTKGLFQRGCKVSV